MTHWLQVDADRRRMIAEFYDKKCEFKRVRYTPNEPADGKLMTDLIRGPLTKHIGRVGYSFLDVLDLLAEQEGSDVNYFQEIPTNLYGMYGLSDDPTTYY